MRNKARKKLFEKEWNKDKNTMGFETKMRRRRKIFWKMQFKNDKMEMRNSEKVMDISSILQENFSKG